MKNRATRPHVCDLLDVSCCEFGHLVFTLKDGDRVAAQGHHVVAGNA